VQNELMTSREWQHALYIRDRWNVNARLTLDLGLRWEYYPIMARADGRGLDRLDLQTLDVIVAGRWQQPAEQRDERRLDNFAPRVGGVYRLNDRPSSAAATASPTTRRPGLRAFAATTTIP
jgi:outer membrane receptor protein involved in Fe transport